MGFKCEDCQIYVDYESKDPNKCAYDDDRYNDSWWLDYRCCNCAKAEGWSNYGEYGCKQCKERARPQEMRKGGGRGGRGGGGGGGSGNDHGGAATQLVKNPPDQTVVLKGLKLYADPKQLNEFLDDVDCKTIFPSKPINDSKRAGSKLAYLNYASTRDAQAALDKLLSSSMRSRLPGFVDRANFDCCLKTAKPASKPSSWTSHESDGSESEDDIETFAEFLVKRLQNTPGGRINASQVPKLATKKVWRDELNAAGGVKYLCLDHVGRLKWIHDGGSGEVGLDTQKRGVNVGDAIKLTSSRPALGRGDVHSWSIGKVISIKDNVCVVDFPEQSGWRGHVADVGKASEEEQRALSISPKDTKFGCCVFVRDKGAGVFEFTGRADDCMPMFEKEYGLIRASTELGRNQGGGYFEVEIMHDNPNGIAVGLCGEKFTAGMQVGWVSGSIGYYSDDGKLFFQQGDGRSFGPTCGVGDRMGCGTIVGTLSTTVYYTKNGSVIGRFLVDVKSDEENQFPLFPAVTSSSPAAVKVYLDAKPPQGATERACVLRTKMMEAKYRDDSTTWKSVTKQGPMRDNGDLPVTFEKSKDIVWVKPKDIRIAKGKETCVDEQGFASLELALSLSEAGDTVEVHNVGIHMMSKPIIIRKDLTIKGIPSSSGRPTISFSGARAVEVRSNLTVSEMRIKSVDGDSSARIKEGGAVALFVMTGTADLTSCTLESQEGTGLYVDNALTGPAKVIASKCEIGPCRRHGAVIDQKGSELRMLRIIDVGMTGLGINPGAGVLISECEIRRCKQKGIYCLSPTELVLISSTTISDCAVGVELSRVDDSFDHKPCALKFVRCKIVTCSEGITAKGKDTHVHWDQSNTFNACNKTAIISLGAKLHDSSSDPAGKQPLQRSPSKLKTSERAASSGGESSPMSPSPSTMEAGEENFWRFFRLVTNIGAQVLQCTFKERYKQESGQAWSASLGAELFKELPRKSLDKLGKQACDFIKAGESEKWDITVLSSLLLFEPGYLKKGSPEFKACEQIRYHRNQLNHAKCFTFKCDNCSETCKCGLGQPIISQDDFNKLWAAVSDTIQSLVQSVLPKKESDSFLSTIKTLQAEKVRVAETTDLRDRLFSEMKEYSEKLQLLEDKIVTKSFFHKTIESLAMLFHNGKVNKNKLPTTITLDNKKEYTLIRQAGHGGMGTVFEALDHASQDRVAVKICDGGDEAHAEREVQNMRKLTEISSSENVVQFIDSTIHNSHYAIIMEFITGKSLQQILFDRSLPTQNGHMSWQETLPIMLQTAAGMAAVHKLKISHRDLKPANIMMSDASQRIVIVDFGLSKQQGANQSVTGAGGPGGTTLYMSPEQADSESKTSDAQLQMDVWAMGIIWYEMLCGVTPFEPIKCADSDWAEFSSDARSSFRIDMSTLNKKNEAQIVIAIDQNPVPWERMPKSVPMEIQAIIDKCLQKDKTDRFQNAQELLENIKDVKAQLEAPKGGDQGAAKSSQSSAAKPFKHWSVDEVAELLAKCGFHEAAGLAKQDGLDGQTWLEIEQQDEKEQEEIFGEHLKLNKLKRMRFRKERGGPSK